MTLPVELNHLSGKAAVWVRGFVSHALSHGAGEVKLRPAQKAGMDAVEELGETISVPYVSKLTKLLEEANVVTKTRKGKGYVITPGENLNQMGEHLHDSEWGSTIEREDSDDTIRMRSAILDHMTDVGSVRIEAERPLDKRAYQVLIDKFKAGKYDMVFVDRDVPLRMVEDDGETGYHVETIHASVANR